VTIDLPKPHFTVVIDDTVGDTATLAETPDGEIIFTVHPSAAEDDSPARYSGHAAFKKAVELVTRRRQGPATDMPS
jgi:hypothetical protein